MAISSLEPQDSLVLDALGFYKGEADVLHRDIEQAELHFQTAGDFQRYRGMLLAYVWHIVKASGKEGAVAHFLGKDKIKTVDDLLKMTLTKDRHLFLLSDNVQSLYGSEADALRIDLGKAMLMFQGRDSFRGYRHIILKEHEQEMRRAE